MNAPNEPWTATGPRTFFAMAGSVGLLWQAILIGMAFTHAEALRAMLLGAGLEPPLITRLFFMTYAWWPLVLLASAVSLFLQLRRTTLSPSALALTAAIPLLVGMLLQTWLNEAATAPLYQIIQRLG